MKKLILVMATLLLVSFPADAQEDAPPVKNNKLDIIKMSYIERFNTLDDKTFLDSTTEYREKPYNDKFLEYSIRVPKDWRKSAQVWGMQGKAEEKKKDFTGSVSLNRRVLGKVGRFFGPTRIGALSHIEISASVLDYEMTARNWFLSTILSSGYTIQGVEELSDRRVEAMYTLFEEDTSFIVRIVAEINGPRIVVVAFYTPESHWEEEKALQEKVLASFKLLNPEKGRIESTRTYAFLDLARFDYPISWKLLAPNIYSVDSMDVRLINEHEDGTLDGEIEVHLISTELETTLAQEVEDVREDMKDSGLEIGDLIETVDKYKFNDFLYYSRVEVYQAPASKKSKVKDHELWLAILAEDRYYYILTMLTPDRNLDFYNWARNSESFKVILESLRP
jgi:hypothetical protein